MAKSSRQTIYSNEDLNKPITGSKSRVYTNKDLNVQDDFEPDSSDNEIDDFQPDDFEPEVAPQSNISTISPNKSFLESMTSTPEFINRASEGMNKAISRPELDMGDSNYAETPANMLDLVKGFLNPVDVATTALTGGAGLARRAGLSLVSKLMRGGAGIAGTAGVAHGGQNVYEGLSEGNNLQTFTGATEMLGNAIPASNIVKPAIRGAGVVTEAAGKGLQNYPLTDWLPGSRLVVPPAVRRLDKNLISGAAGRGLESVGSKMRNIGRTESPPIVPPVDDILNEPSVMPKRNMRERIQEIEELPEQVMNEGAPEVQLSQNPFKSVSEGIDFLNDNSSQVTPSAIPPRLMKDYKWGDYPEDSAPMSPSAIEAMEQVRPTKPAVRLNPDGTYTRFDTGEIVDSRGRPMATPTEPMIEPISQVPTRVADPIAASTEAIGGKGGKPIIKTVTEIDGTNRVWIDGVEQTQHFGPGGPTNSDIAQLHRVVADPQSFRRLQQLKNEQAQHIASEPKNVTPKAKEITIKNAPPNQRAKVMRGQHDAVDIFFENANDRRVFGAGQNMFTSGKVTNPALIQTYTDVTTTIAKEYGLPIEKARELVTGYNRRLRELSKDMPKRGEDLNFKAPSFETFMDSALRGKQPTHPLNIVKKETGSVTIKNPVLKQLGSNKETMPRDIFDKLISEGWTVKGATLSQAWPPGNPKHPSVRVVQISGTDKRPMIFEPPKSTHPMNIKGEKGSVTIRQGDKKFTVLIKPTEGDLVTKKLGPFKTIEEARIAAKKEALNSGAKEHQLWEGDEAYNKYMKVRGSIGAKGRMWAADIIDFEIDNPHPLNPTGEKGSVTIRQGSENPYKKNRVDTPVSQENPGTQSYADELLEYTTKGEPGVSIKDMTPSIKDTTKFRKDYEIAYRNPQGKPVAVARYRHYPGDVFDITDLALDKNAGLLRGKALNSIVDKLQEMGITNVTGSVSPGFLNYINKKLDKSIKSKAFTDSIN